MRPRRVVVKDTRTRWGSCTADGTLMFCWRLVMAPPEVQERLSAALRAALREERLPLVVTVTGGRECVPTAPGWSR